MVSSVRLRVTCVACLFTGAHVPCMCSVLLAKAETERKMKKWEPMWEKRTISLSLWLNVCFVYVLHCILFYFIKIVSKVLVWSHYSRNACLYLLIGGERKRKPQKKRVSASLRISFTSIHTRCVWLCACMCRAECITFMFIRSLSPSLSHTHDKISRSIRGCLNRLRQWGSVHSKSQHRHKVLLVC